MKDLIKIGIAGATGYIGLELVKILTKHPKAKVVYLCAQKSLGKKINKFDKKIKNINLPRISHIRNIDWKKIDVIFTALPNGEAHKIATLKPDSVKLIDLSADFRLNSTSSYKKWYGGNLISKTLLNKSIYSVTEFKKKK